MYSWLPRVLLIGPGGIKGLKVLGFLSPLEDAGLLELSDTYCGVSVGAVITLLKVAGYQIREIVGEATNLDFFKDMDNFSFGNAIENKGLISNEPIKKRLTELILNKFGMIPTLKSLYLQTGKSFVAVTFNATDEICVMLDYFHFPTMSCIDAAMYSMNIPFIFYQLYYQGKIFVDGLLGNPYPIDYFDNGETNILGIFMRTYNLKEANVPNKIISKIADKNSMSFATFTAKIIHAMTDQRRYNIIHHSSKRCRHVCLETKNFNTIGYNMTFEEKAELLTSGYNQGKEFLRQLRENCYVDPEIPLSIKYTYPDDNLENLNVVEDMNKPTEQ